MEEKASAPATEPTSQAPHSASVPQGSESGEERAEWSKCPPSNDGMPKCTYRMTRKANSKSYGKLCPKNGIHEVDGKLYCYKHKGPAENRRRKMENAKAKLNKTPTPDETDKKPDGASKPEEKKSVEHDVAEVQEDVPKKVKKRKIEAEDLPTPPEPQSLKNHDDADVESVEVSSDEEKKFKKEYRQKKKRFVKKKLAQYFEKRRKLQEMPGPSPTDPTLRRTKDVFGNATQMSQQYYAPKPPVSIDPHARMFS